MTVSRLWRTGYQCCEACRGMVGIPSLGEEHAEVGIPEVVGFSDLAITFDESTAVDEEQDRLWALCGNRLRVRVVNIELSR